jgi:cell wall-associated NlpC family hydrolase
MTRTLRPALTVLTVLTVLAVLALSLFTTVAANAASTPYQAPSHLNATKVLTNSFQVNWNPESGPGFLVQTLTSSGASVSSFSTSKDYANVGNVASGKKYVVRVRVDVPGAPYAQVAVTTQDSFNQKVAAYVQTLEGVPYLYGGTSLQGFDCSGLTQYVYAHFGEHIQRTANDQFLEFRPETQAQSVPGDLVFFHDTSNPASDVYHVGVYEGGENMVDAPHTGTLVQWESFAWAGDSVTFGTIAAAPLPSAAPPAVAKGAPGGNLPVYTAAGLAALAAAALLAVTAARRARRSRRPAPPPV